MWLAIQYSLPEIKVGVDPVSVNRPLVQCHNLLPMSQCELKVRTQQVSTQVTERCVTLLEVNKRWWEEQVNGYFTDVTVFFVLEAHWGRTLVFPCYHVSIAKMSHNHNSQGPFLFVLSLSPPTSCVSHTRESLTTRFLCRTNLDLSFEYIDKIQIPNYRICVFVFVEPCHTRLSVLCQAESALRIYDLCCCCMWR